MALFEESSVLVCKSSGDYSLSLFCPKTIITMQGFWASLWARWYMISTK